MVWIRRFVGTFLPAKVVQPPDWVYEDGEWVPGDPTGLAHGTYSDFDFPIEVIYVGPHARPHARKLYGAPARKGVILSYRPWWRRHFRHRWEPTIRDGVLHCARPGCDAHRITFPECPDGGGSSSPSSSG